ncbi:MAG: response regulator [Candidatus Kaelpia imicola]|nr:response regulator [Candidatus Kaelpia imicola]
MKILIADDEKDLVFLLKMRLESVGFEIATAYDGIEALQKAHSESPDLIILDIMMPAGDGFRICEKLKSEEDTSSIPVIFLTAKTLDKDERKGLSIGAEYYFKKPFEAEDLIETINKVLKKPQQLREEIKHSKVWKLFLITDNIDVLQLLEPKLKEENFQYQIAQKREDILSKLNLFDPQLIVFDVYAKSIDALRFLEEMKDEESIKKAPFVLLAAPGDKGRLEDYKNIVQIIDIVENPYDILELIAVIKAHFK